MQVKDHLSFNLKQYTYILVDPEGVIYKNKKNKNKTIKNSFSKFK